MEDNFKPIVIDVRNARAGEVRAALERLALVTGDPAYHRAELPSLARRKWLISRAFRGEAESATGYGLWVATERRT